MNELVKELWLKNYRSEGDAAELENSLKNFPVDKGKTLISYIPWAVAERIFKFQGGTIEVVRTQSNSIVEVDEVVTRRDIDIETGVVEERVAKSFFVNVKATWNGETYTERYPILGQGNVALQQWTQSELNRSVQRAKVKAIAIVSGIGYKLFEDGDLQFDEGDGKTETKVETKKATESKLKQPETKVAPKAEPKVEPKVALKVAPKPEKVDVRDTLFAKEQPVEPISVFEEEEIILPDRVSIENGIKEMYLAGGAKVESLIQSFLKPRNTLKIQQLSDKDLKELHFILKEFLGK